MSNLNAASLPVEGPPPAPAPASGAGGAPPPAPSRHAGMGAIPYADDGDVGVSFRVWAPNAAGVSVAGSWNGFAAGATPLAREENGHWSADVPGVKAGDEYAFVVRTAQGDELRRRDPYAAEIGLVDRNCVVADPAFDWGDDAPWFTPAWNELVIYELHVGTFNDPDAAGRPGTFDSVVARLAYLADLGVNCIEIMPSVEFAGDFSWGYNPADIFAIESAYGGPDALKRLVRAAHESGIAVIFDVVYNHFGPSDLDLWRFDGWARRGRAAASTSTTTGARPRRGAHTRPDYGREEVRRFILDNAMRWLEEFRFDGLRWDATAYIRNVNGNNDDRAHDLPDGWALMQSSTARPTGASPGSCTSPRTCAATAGSCARPSWAAPASTRSGTPSSFTRCAAR